MSDELIARLRRHETAERVADDGTVFCMECGVEWDDHAADNRDVPFPCDRALAGEAAVALTAAAARIAELEAEMAYLAEAVGAQTLDLAAIGKGRKKILRDVVEWMCVLSEGGSLPPKVVTSTAAKVRERFDPEHP